jgi:hypothetical protein
MVGVIFLLILFFGINQLIFNFYNKKHSFLDKKKLNQLYLYHIVFYGIYTWYAYNNASDSHRYFSDLGSHEESWFGLFGTDTLFINFLSFPFYKLGFNYDMLMFTFAWFGYLGFIYAYLFVREKIPVKIKVFKRIDLLSLILFFPNMHFWTASLGKGAPIFLGLMMFSYAIIKPTSRIFLLLLSSVIIFYIRPHVFMFVAIGAALGYMSGKEKISLRKKLLIFSVMIGALIIVQDQILAVMGLEDSEHIVEDFQKVSDIKSEDLSAAGSGVNMSSYPLPFKLFTFWFRPLFIDAPNFLGIITSIENLMYLLLFYKIFKKDFIKFIKRSPSIVKMSLVIFISASIAMTFIMSNLGLIMRQKTMVMMFAFFVIYYYLAEKKYRNYIRLKRLKERKNKELEKQQELLSQ